MALPRAWPVTRPIKRKASDIKYLALKLYNFLTSHFDELKPIRFGIGSNTAGVWGLSMRNHWVLVFCGVY